MARQGKLHSSPFHVETVQYMYAIEHENESEYVPSSEPVCAFHNRVKRRCEKWNSGYPQCESHRCRYLNSSTRRHAVCSDCAFCYCDKCFHQKAPVNLSPEPEEGSFCYFFCSEHKQPNKFRYVRKNCERLVISQKMKACRTAIKSKKKYIKQADRELDQETTPKDTREYLQAKCSRFNEEIAVLTEQLARLETRVNKLGGYITRLPWSEST